MVTFWNQLKFLDGVQAETDIPLQKPYGTGRFINRACTNACNLGIFWITSGECTKEICFMILQPVFGNEQTHNGTT